MTSYSSEEEFKKQFDKTGKSPVPETKGLNVEVKKGKAKSRKKK
jgi:hypothetical protein